jgi:hypothetical protein
MRVAKWLGVFLFMWPGLVACDALDQISQAGEMAEVSVYYAQLGTQLNQVEEQGFPPVMQSLTDAVGDPSQREVALSAAEALVTRIDGVVEANRPENADTHPGYQAAHRMVEMRRQAVTDLRQSWQGARGPEASADGIIAFSSAWMAAQQQFMLAVGGHSQQVFGPAAQRAAEGSGATDLPGVQVPPTPATSGGK